MEQKIENSEAFLKTVLHKSTGFSAPKNYFSSAEDHFSSFLIEKELSKENGFTIPENYFEEIESSLIEKIIFKKEVKVISFKNKLIKYIPITAAASIALFLSVNYLNSFDTKEINFNALGNTDIENWIVENSNELSNKDFRALLHSGISHENDLALIDLQNKDIEEYMINSEENSLLNEDY